MSFGYQLKKRREELGLSRAVFAERLGVTASAISNYENGLSFPKEEVMLRLFDSLEVDPPVPPAMTAVLPRATISSTMGAAISQYLLTEKSSSGSATSII